jgi:succinyl-CoA synthetase beta subunit
LVWQVSTPVILTTLQVRWLNLHEYQSKSLLQKFGVTVQRFKVASTVDEVEEAAKSLSN